ncbi:MAG: PDZ domain-containing protein [Nitrospinota bacterium]
MNTGQKVLLVGIISIVVVMGYNLLDSPNYGDFPVNPKIASIAESGGLIPVPERSVKNGNQAPLVTARSWDANAGDTTAGGAIGGVAASVVAPGPDRGYTAPDIKLAEGHWQGMEIMALSAEFKQKMQLPPGLSGLLVDEVTLFAASSGLLGGDILVEINGHKVHTLKEMLMESKRVKNRSSVPLTVLRYGRRVKLTLRGKAELGFAQMETAPMILAGALMPHPYRGSCTTCHPIGNTGHVRPDPDGITLPPPMIRAVMKSPHQDRGPCKVCHVIVN